MKTPILIWLILFALVLASFLVKGFPFWVAIIMYVILVLVRLNEIIGNFNDDNIISNRNKDLMLNQKAEEMAGRGLASSGLRNQEETKIKEDFALEKKKRRRKFFINLVNTLFLK